jgi:hypothetical protein
MRRLAGLVLALAMVTTACSLLRSPEPSRSPSIPDSGSPRPSVEVKTGETTALQAMERLCVEVDTSAAPAESNPTPPAIAEVERQVEAARGLEFERRVNVEPITPQEIDRRLARYFDDYYPRKPYARRTLAWRTIGAIPPGIGILEALRRYQQGQVLGFYNSQNEELVYTGDEELSRIEQFILAHELTHAIDDQHFDLDRLDELSNACDDERFLAALGVVEGSANHFATEVIVRFPISEIGEIPGGGAQGVPPIITQIQAYPYTSGQAFVDHLADEGGVPAVNAALWRFPTTTEQVLHPERFGQDDPTEVDVPDFAPTFGEGWRDLDVMIAGELWLRVLLDIELSELESASGADGWDGGIYRAWTDGEEAAVILATTWDAPIEAAEFRGALTEWIGDRRDRTFVEGQGNAVIAGFATGEDLMPALESAIRSM